MKRHRIPTPNYELISRPYRGGCVTSWLNWRRRELLRSMTRPRRNKHTSAAVWVDYSIIIKVTSASTEQQTGFQQPRLLVHLPNHEYYHLTLSVVLWTTKLRPVIRRGANERKGAPRAVPVPLEAVEVEVGIGRRKDPVFKERVARTSSETTWCPIAEDSPVLLF